MRHTCREERLLQALLVIERGLYPQVRRARQNAFCERQHALHVEFVDRLGVVVNLRERQLLAELIALTLAALDVYALREQDRVVRPIELLLDGLDAPLLLWRPAFRFGPSLLLEVENPVLDQPHVAGRRLKEREFVGERAFEHGLADVHRAALPLAVVVRVVTVAVARSSKGCFTNGARSRS